MFNFKTNTIMKNKLFFIGLLLCPALLPAQDKLVCRSGLPFTIENVEDASAGGYACPEGYSVPSTSVDFISTPPSTPPPALQ
jgi:hypothetical protein